MYTIIKNYEFHIALAYQICSFERKLNIKNNFSKNNKTRTFKGLQSVIALTHIDENGKAESFPIAINEEQGVLFQPGLTSSFGKDKKIIYGEKGKNFRFGILTF